MRYIGWTEVRRKNRIPMKNMGKFRSKEDDVARLSTSVFVSNLPDFVMAKDLFHACKQYGHAVDSFIPFKRDKNDAALVIGDECLSAKDFSLALFGRVKEFASMANLKVAIGNEGFAEISINYIGELWRYEEFYPWRLHQTFRIAWVELEKGSVKVVRGNIRRRFIKEEFKIIHRGKSYWIRANETVVGVPDFTDESDDDEVDDTYSSVDGSDNQILGDDKVLNFENAVGNEAEVEVSEDPFGLYTLLNKPKIFDRSDNNSGNSLKFPPGFTPPVDKEVANFEAVGDKPKCCAFETKVTRIMFMNDIYDGCGLVEDSWKNSPSIDSNAMKILMGKLKHLKNIIRDWNKNNMSCRKNVKVQFKKDLEAVNQIIDSGQGVEEDIRIRSEIILKIRKCDEIDSLEMAQKTKIKWAVEGDENSKFFHGMLNKKRNNLSIRGVLVDGVWVDEPKDVKKEFFDHFSKRFCKPGNRRAKICMEFPNRLNSDQMHDLEAEVSKDEVKRAVWECGTDKAPGPDGFTFGFFRHFWYLVEKDVIDAVSYFFSYADIPRGCNSSFIALIPKIPDANVVKDFRPISLIGSLYKIIAKILTNRLVNVLGGLVNEVQSAFVANRQILDGPFIINELFQWCKSKKKQTLIFKVDFEKAYDSVRWDFLDEVLSKFGFGEKWRKWIQCCLHSSRGSIIINGSPTDEFIFGKGLKQGDPLSPFLFILIMESLHLSFQRVVDEGLFHGIKLHDTVNISHLFYADDAVFVGQWSDRNISTLTYVLECFYLASGLKINMSKSKIMGIHVNNDNVNRAAENLGCLVLKAPFMYLGSTVGGDMHRLSRWKDTIDRVRRRLSKWKMKMLSIGGRLTLVKSVLGSMPIFHMSLFKVPSGILKVLESIRSHFFNGHDISSKKVSWVNWNKVIASKDKGGLGVSSLYALNRGLLFKWIWRFLTQGSSLWAKVIKAIHGVDGNLGSNSKGGMKSCWSSIVTEVNALANKGIDLMQFLRIKMGNGDSIRLWEDPWHEGGILKLRYPRVYALEMCKSITIGGKLAHPNLSDSFRRYPRGGAEFSQFGEFSALMHQVIRAPMADRWMWTRNSSGEFTVASVRQFIDDKICIGGDHKTTWIRFIPNKVNIHAWKVMLNALPTKFNISRRGIQIDSIICVNCGIGVETTNHLFFTCEMAQKVSHLINRWWDVPDSEFDSYASWKVWVTNIRLPGKTKLMFEGVYNVMWWLLWWYRNQKIFEAKAPNKAVFFDDVIAKSFYWCMYRSKASFSWNDWLKNPNLIIL
ncbi:RNA-directed DNA polymerase, eukaryota [Tanacetum coccineum]